MTPPLATRSRWVRCCCIVSVSIASATIYWRLPRSADKSDAMDVVSRGNVIEEAELAPTLANAQEIRPIQTPGVTANSTWNPEPNWNPAWSIEQLPRPASSTARSTPIPDTFPLEPRLKKEPPAIGDAFVLLPNNQLRPSTNSSTKASPFGAPIAIASPQEPTVHLNLRASIPTSLGQKPDWPDQTYASNVIPADDSGKRIDKSKATDELSTPHLLTGTEVRIKPRPAQLAPPVADPSSGFSIKPNQPSPGNYILQPMRDQPK